MKRIKQQNYSEVKEVETSHQSPGFWLRLLGDTAQVSQSTNGRNDNQTRLPVVADRPEMTDYPPEIWLRLLSGAPLAGGSANNGRSAKPKLEASHPQDQQFITEFWLRLLGENR